MVLLNRMCIMLSTLMYLGYVKKAPGTFGSLAAFLFLPLLVRYPTISIVCICITFFISIFAIDIYCKHNNTGGDPKEVIIDEFIAQCLIFVFLVFIDRNSFLNMFISFIIFRVLDIMKPFPISWFDNNIKGGLGVNLDDIIAALFTMIIMYVCSYGFFV